MVTVLGSPVSSHRESVKSVCEWSEAAATDIVTVPASRRRRLGLWRASTLATAPRRRRAAHRPSVYTLRLSAIIHTVQ